MDNKDLDIFFTCPSNLKLTVSWGLNRIGAALGPRGFLLGVQVGDHRWFLAIGRWAP